MTKTIEPVPFYITDTGPITGHPGPHPGFDGPVSERWAWVLAKRSYLEAVQDAVNKSVDRALIRALA